MTITTSPARAEYTATAGQTVFNYTFKIFSDTDLNVYVTPSGQVANDATDITTSYTVTGVGAEAGGTIILSVGASNGDLVTIVSNIPSSRTTDYQTNGDFLPQTVNDDFDRVLSIVKKIEDTTNRSVVTAQSQQGPKPLSLDQPVAGKLLRWNGAEDGLENVSPSDVPLDTVLTQDLTITKATIAAAKADDDLVNHVGGYVLVAEYTAGNPIDALYEIFAGAGVDDGYLGHNSTTVNLFHLQLIDTLPVDSRVAGLKGDGVTDETSQITIADNVGPIFFRPGTYITTYRPINPVRGEGAILRISGVDFHLDSTYQILANNSGGSFELLNTKLGINAGKLSDAALSYASVVVGGHAGENITALYRTTLIGDFAGQTGVDIGRFDALGSSAAQAAYYGDRCVYIGTNAGKWDGSNDPVGTLHDMFNGVDDPYGFNSKWATWRADWAGLVGAPAFVAASIADNQYNVGLGRNALLHGITVTNCTAVGYNAHAHALNNDAVTAIGRGASRDTIKGNNIVTVGASAMQETMDASEDVVVGSLAGRNIVYSEGNTAIGYAALNNEGGAAPDKPLRNVAVGRNSMRKFIGSVSDNTCVGNMSGQELQGNDNVAVGSNALLVATASNQNTAIGFDALRFTQAAGSHLTFDNVTGIGHDSRVSANNQVQLGDSATTTYAYGAVQARSDARDKADIRDTVLGLDFIEQLRPVDYKWDYRSDYHEEQTDGTLLQLDKDGSKKRSRYHHGLIAQELEGVIAASGVDFGGLQDHSIKGGEDIKSIGYDELIAPLIKAVQELSARVKTLEGN